jgi:hypothetical protein
MALMRLLATSALVAVALLAAAVPGRAETVLFAAQLGGDTNPSGKAAAARGDAALLLDMATKTASLTIKYSGLTKPPRRVACGALDSPAGPAIRLTGNLTSPITGSKALSEPEIAALGAGRWVCVIEGDGDEAEIGGVLQPAP